MGQVEQLRTRMRTETAQEQQRDLQGEQVRIEMAQEQKRLVQGGNKPPPGVLTGMRQQEQEQEYRYPRQ